LPGLSILIFFETSYTTSIKLLLCHSLERSEQYSTSHESRATSFGQKLVAHSYSSVQVCDATGDAMKNKAGFI